MKRRASALLFFASACTPRAALPPPLLPLTLTEHAAFPGAPGAAPDTPAPALPSVHSFALQNGLRVVVVPRADADDVMMQYVALGGADSGVFDTIGHTRLVLDTLEAVLRRDDHADQPSLSMWNDLNAAYVQRTSEPDGLDESVEMLAEALAARRLEVNDINEAARTLIDALRIHHRDQAKLARFHAKQMLYGDEHPLGHPVLGRYENLEHLTVGQLEDRLASMFAPAHSVLFVVGKASPADAEESIRRHLAGIPAGKAKRPFAAYSTPTLPHMRVRGLLTPGVVAQIVQAFDAPARGHPDYAAFSVLSMIAGGLTECRMMTALRHRGAQTYAVYAWYESGVQGSTLMLETQVRKEAASVALSLIDDELERLRAEPVSAAELARAKLQLRERTYDAVESSSSLSTLYSQLVTTRAADPEHLHGAIALSLAELERVDAAAVQRVAQRYLVLDKRGVAVSGPLGDFYRELESWSGGAVDAFVPSRYAE